MNRLNDALSYMKYSLESGFLKNYMIPERNLFSGKLTKESAAKLTRLLGTLIKEGYRVVKRIPRINDAVLQEKGDSGSAMTWKQRSDADETLDIIKKALRTSEINANKKN